MGWEILFSPTLASRTYTLSSTPSLSPSRFLLSSRLPPPASCPYRLSLTPSLSPSCFLVSSPSSCEPIAAVVGRVIIMASSGATRRTTEAVVGVLGLIPSLSLSLSIHFPEELTSNTTMVAHLSSTSLRWQRSRLRQVLVLLPPLAMASGSTVRFVGNGDGGGTNATFGRFEFRDRWI